MTDSNAIVFRQALPEEAAQISALYDDEYRPSGCTDAREHYPFPQILNPLWVSSAVARKDLCWIVAAAGSTIVGSAAAVRNIGASTDQIAELFGIVVSHHDRNHGVGRGLLTHLVAALGRDVQILLCESRTADPRAWRVARHCGFQPIGFEPFAHTTPAGSESMLMTAIVRRVAAPHVRLVAATNAVAELATVVLPAIQSESRMDGEFRELPSDVEVVLDEEADCVPAKEFKFERDDSRGAEFLNKLRRAGSHQPTVVCLERLEGEDVGGFRYSHRYYMGTCDNAVVCGARAVWDQSDRRARILELRSCSRTAEAGLIEFIVSDLMKTVDASPTIVVDIRVDAAAVAEQLERMHFSPTVYYPALICDDAGRSIDAVQFTRLGASPLGVRLGALKNMEWPEAARIIGSVLALLPSGNDDIAFSTPQGEKALESFEGA